MLFLTFSTSDNTCPTRSELEIAYSHEHMIFRNPRLCTSAGPSASLTFSWGECTFNESQFLESDSTKILNCTEPSIEYAKEPAIFTSKYKTGGTFTGKVCVCDFCQIPVSTASMPASQLLSSCSLHLVACSHTWCGKLA